MKKTAFKLFDELYQKINSYLEYVELHKKFANASKDDTTIAELTFETLPHNLTNLAKVIIDLFFKNNSEYPTESHLFIDEFAGSEVATLQLKLGNYIVAQTKFKESFESKNEHEMIISSISQIQHGYEFYDELLKLILSNTFKIVDPDSSKELNNKQYSNKIKQFAEHIKSQYFLDKMYYDELLKIYDSNKRNAFAHKTYIPDVNNRVVKYYDRDGREYITSYDDLLKESFSIYDNIISYIVAITSLGVIAHQKDPNILPKEYLNFCKESYKPNT